MLLIALGMPSRATQGSGLGVFFSSLMGNKSMGNELKKSLWRPVSLSQKTAIQSGKGGKDPATASRHDKQSR